MHVGDADVEFGKLVTDMLGSKAQRPKRAKKQSVAQQVAKAVRSAEAAAKSADSKSHRRKVKRPSKRKTRKRKGQRFAISSLTILDNTQQYLLLGLSSVLFDNACSWVCLRRLKVITATAVDCSHSATP